ncbi:MAG: GNAT family N-acetyltransferase [Synechococcales cyanobacterium RM1_1_8]|nr:GNAT family N-acetyltransferase [Synechococcales cyanobacterium RM1_1_8]
MKQTYGPFLIRDWQAGDRAAAAQVIGDALQEFGLGWEPDGADADAWQVEQHYQNGQFWVVEQGKELVATAAFLPIERGRRAVEIRKMYLKPQVRRRGLGRYLLQQLEAEIAARGFQQIWLETATALTGASEFYESTGYRLPQAGDLGAIAAAPLSDKGCNRCDPNSLIETERCDRIYIKQLPWENRARQNTRD